MPGSKKNLCAVLCCAVLCCAVLCCAVLCCAVLEPNILIPFCQVFFSFFGQRPVFAGFGRILAQDREKRPAHFNHRPKNYNKITVCQAFFYRAFS
jgi:uncharacterized protein (DUF2225 family)